MYPEIKRKLEQDSREFKQSPLGSDTRSDMRLKTLKERFLVVYSLLRLHPEAPEEKKQEVANMIHTSEDLRGAEQVLLHSEPSQTSGVLEYRVAKFATTAFSTIFGSWLRDVRAEARQMPGGDFMANLELMLVEEPVLAGAAKHIEAYFIQKLRERVHILASGWARSASKIELEGFNQHQRLEATALENKDRLASRAELLQDLRKVLVRHGPSKCANPSSVAPVTNCVCSAGITIDSIKQTQGRYGWVPCKALVL
jgi:hypothetical protein